MTDVLQGIAENTSSLGGVKFKNRYYDIITMKVDGRTADEIVEDVINKSGLEVTD